MLPTFVVIGAPKAGTTALYWYLAEHPQVHMSALKETNFFAYGVDDAGRLRYGDPQLHRFPVRSLDAYERLFADADGATAVGEISPIYLECPQAAGRMAGLLPDAQIVCVLRNPVDRAYSDYQMYLRTRGRRLDPERDLTVDAPWAQADSHWVRVGRYHQHLTRYYAAYRPEQIHVQLFDELRSDTTAAVQAIYRALGVDDTFVPDLDTPHNVGGVPANMAFERVLTSKRIKRMVEPWIPRRLGNLARRVRTANLQRPPALPDPLRAQLTDHFRADIAGTEALIGRDLQHWLSSDS
ncbi:MAG TPA: sulfotransferase [Euzebyales bacterium]